MRNTKMPFIFAFLFICAFSGPSLAQQRVFNWLPGNDESVRLDPANYHAGLTYHPAGNGGNIQVDIRSEQPVTIFLTRAEEWNEALKNPEGLGNLRQLCQREHVVETRYSCFVPPESMTLVIRDERNSPDTAVFAGLGAVLNSNNKAERAASEESRQYLRARVPRPRVVSRLRTMCTSNTSAGSAWKTASSRSINGLSRLKRSIS